MWGVATNLRGGTPPSIFMPLGIPSLKATTHRRVGVGVLWMKSSLISLIGRRRSVALFLAIIRAAGWRHPHDSGGLPLEAHVRYETLHPFTDGNGRTGRALWYWMMVGSSRADLGFLHAFYYQTLKKWAVNKLEPT
jgi:hypothetical protein